MEPLETRLGYQFRDPKLLAEAITHPSVSYESKVHTRHNQRLEYLGDAVLQLVLTELLFQKFPTEPEGPLTKMRTRLVQARTLAKVARQISLGDYLILGRGEEANGGRKRDSTLSDAYEAVLGAIHVDGGLEPVREFILRTFAGEMAELMLEPVEHNPKGDLQEMLQDATGIAPSYVILASEGPDHARSFRAAVHWSGKELGSGSGNSKKEAQAAAALNALGSPLLKQTIAEAISQKV